MSLYAGLQFARTVAPSSKLAPVVLKLFNHYKWRRTILIEYTSPGFMAVASAWSAALESALIEIKRVGVSRRECNDRDGSGLTNVLDRIVRSKWKIVLVLAASDDIGTIARAADVHGIVGAGWAWISDVLCARIDVTRRSTDEEVRFHLHRLHFAVLSCLPLSGCSSVAVCRGARCAGLCTGGSTSRL